CGGHLAGGGRAGAVRRDHRLRGLYRFPEAPHALQRRVATGLLSRLERHAPSTSQRSKRMTDAFTIGEDLTVHRLGFGAMRLTGEGIWGPPENPAEAQAVLRRALELGVDFIDTADSYGPEVSEKLIADTLAPYPAGLVIATKG